MRMDDDLWIEEAIAQELDAISDETIDDQSIGENNHDEESAPAKDDSDNEQDSLLPSMQEYIDKIQQQSAQLQVELDECDDVLHHSDLVSARRPVNDELVELANQQGLTVEQLKQKVLHEIEEEEKEERCVVMTDVAMDTVTDLFSTAQLSARTPATEEITMGAFLTSVQPGGADHTTPRDSSPLVNNESETNNANNRLGNNESETDDAQTGLAHGHGDVLMNLHAMKAIEPPPNTNTVLEPSLPESGTVAVMFNSEQLERQLLQEVLQIDEQHRAMHDRRIQEHVENRKTQDEKAEHVEEKRHQKQAQLKQEEEVMIQERQERDTTLRREAEVLQKATALSLDQYEKEINELSRQAQIDKVNFEHALLEEKQKQDKKREEAAIEIQKIYRGYVVRKEYGAEVNATLDEWRARKYEQRVEQVQHLIDERVGKEQREKEEKETIEKEEAERKLQVEEEKKRKLEDEKLRKEEEKRQKEEEKKQKAEEKKRKAEEEKKRKEEEKRKNEEEKRRKEEEVKHRKEEEKRRKEEEKLRKEEAEKQKKEEEKMKKLQEEERKRKEVEQIEEELRKEKDRIAKEEESKINIEKKEPERKDLSETTRSSMDVIGEAVTPTERGMTELLIQQVARINSTEPPENGITNTTTPTPRSPNASNNQATHSPGNKTPRPPSAKKPDSTYERPISGKQQSPNKSIDADHVLTRKGVPHVISVDNTRKSIQSQHELAKSQQWGEYLPKAIDDARLHWIGKQCKSLGNIISDNYTRQGSTSKKPIRRPSSAKCLPPLDEQAILTAARVNALKMVTTVELSDLPGCTLKTLSHCTHLKSLTMTQCNLVTTDGLEQCKLLQYLNLQNNKLEVISLKDLQALVYLDLSHNALPSVHGLDGCGELRYMDVSHNKISRIGALDSLKKLHTLCMSHNQLITTRGLSGSPSIQNLDLSANHLQAIDDLENLALLQTLVASGNNLMQVPKLTNHVILNKLILSDNSISFLSAMTQTWLPMLSHLNLSQNSISVLDPMLNLLLLEHADLSNNQLIDTDQLLPALLATRYLLTLDLSGNPACEDQQFSAKIQKVVPFLEKLNNTMVSPSSCGVLHRTEFERLCLAQSLQVQQLYLTYSTALKKCSCVTERIDMHCKYFETSHSLATDMRYTHEYGVSMVTPKEIDMNFEVAKQNGALVTNTSPNVLTPISNIACKSKFDDTLKGNTAKISPRTPTNDLSLIGSNIKNAFDDAVSNSNSSRNAFEQALSKQQRNVGIDIARQSLKPMDAKASFEQNIMRSMANTNSKASSPATNMKSKFDAALNKSVASVVENGAAKAGMVNGNGGHVTSSRSFTTHVKTSKVIALLNVSHGEYSLLLDFCAAKIQACWRGYILRKRLTLALSYAKFDDLDDDLEQFDEVNLDFNMDGLDDDLIVPDTPQLPANHPVLGKPPSHPTHQPLTKPPAVPPLFDAHAITNNTQAWRNTDSPVSGGAAGKPPLPPLSRLSDAHTYDSNRTARAKKEDKIAEDWGFKDSKTAELMLQRAKKLKYNALKKKKLSQLDPRQRLELYKRLEDASHVTVKAARKHSLPRKEYFKALEDNARRVELEHRAASHEQVQRTFEWIHTQVGPQHEVTSSRIQNSVYGSDGNLPRMDPAVLAGGRAMLAVSPASMEVLSIGSASTIADPATKPQRLWRTSATQDNKFPPIKTNSAPSAKSKERMSIRNTKTDVDVGWGGGRKRKS